MAALEEGAACATFVDQNRAVMDALRKTASPFSSLCRFHRREALGFLRKTTETYDIIFSDPPFPLWEPGWGDTLYSLVAPRLAQGGIFLVKHPSRMIASSPPSELVHWKDSRFGESRLIYLKKKDP